MPIPHPKSDSLPISWNRDIHQCRDYNEGPPRGRGGGGGRKGKTYLVCDNAPWMNEARITSSMLYHSSWSPLFIAPLREIDKNCQIDKITAVRNGLVLYPPYRLLHCFHGNTSWWLSIRRRWDSIGCLWISYWSYIKRLALPINFKWFHLFSRYI